MRLPQRRQKTKTPVIFNTDIGGDIDDVWALYQLMRTEAFDVKLIATDGGSTLYRARVAAKAPTEAGLPHAPIGIGLDPVNADLQQAGWLGDYDIASYPGYVHEDGVGAIIETIMTSPTPVTIISVGPTQSLAAALARANRASPRTRVSSACMARSAKVCRAIRRRSRNGTSRSRRKHCAQIFVRMGLHDHAARYLRASRARRLITHRSAPARRLLAQSLIRQYEDWRPKATWLGPEIDPATTQAARLFDCVAVELAHDETWFEMETLPLVVTDDGFTRVDAANGQSRALRDGVA